MKTFPIKCLQKIFADHVLKQIFWRKFSFVSFVQYGIKT